MWKKFIIQIILFSLVIVLIFFAYKFYFKKESPIEINDVEKTENIKLEKDLENSNLIKKLTYLSKDELGNEYLIESESGEIDLNNPDLILMKNVKAKILMARSEPVYIKSEKALYNNSTFETIFETNVIVEYLQNKIIGQKFNISLKDNFAKMTNDVIYSNQKIKLMADVIELDIITKNSKIFMFDKNKKIKIINK